MICSSAKHLMSWRAAALAACLTGAAATPAWAGAFEFPDNQDISDMPGVFTGNTGGFTVTVWRDGRRTNGRLPSGDAPGARHEGSPHAFPPPPEVQKSIVPDRPTSD